MATNKKKKKSFAEYTREVLGNDVEIETAEDRKAKLAAAKAENIAPLPNTQSAKEIADMLVMPTAGELADMLASPAAFRSSVKTAPTVAPLPSSTERNKVFEKGAFDDGYQFGDVLKTTGATATDLILSAAQGVGNAAEGLTDLAGYGIAKVADKLGAERIANSIKYDVKQNKVDSSMQELRDSWGIDNNSVLGEIPRGVGQGVGQVMTMIATGGLGAAAGLGSAGVSALTLGTMGLSSTGSGMSEAYQNGATDGEALAYGAMQGAIDTITEMAFGGLGKTVKALGVSRGIGGLDDMFAKKLTSKITNHLVRNSVQYGIKATGEGLEEVAAGALSAVAKNLTYKSDEELNQLVEDENLLEQFVIGTLTSAVSQGGDLVNSVNNKTDFVTGFTDSEQKVVDAEYKKRLAEEEKDGNKLDTKAKNKLYDEVTKDLEKGYISTETIEEVLGGEDYSNYQRELKREQDLDNELNELRNMKSSDMTDIQTERMAELKARKPNTEMMNTLKFGIDENIRNGIKDSRLVESYNEQERRKQAFEADVSQYDENQKAIIQKAIDSKILNNSRRTHEFVDMIAKISADKGVSFDFADNKKIKESGFAIEGVTVNGYVTKDGVTLNIDSKKALNKVVGHEITHVLEGTELYNELQKSIFEYAKSKKDFQGRYDSLTKLYNGIEGADINAELTADLVGDYLFTDEAFINHLSTQNRNVFQKIYDEVKYLVKMATAGSKEARQLEKIKRTFDKIYRESGKVSGDTKYSVSEANADSDGKQLTKEQNEYFKNSKMRDDNGNLKVMYHGSQDAGFHIFDASMSDDGTSFFFVDRNDVAASYSGTSETYEAQTIRTAEDMNKFLVGIGYDSYKAIEKDGKFELLENNEHVAYSDTAQGLYEEFCWYEGVGEGDANYKVYLNLTKPLVIDAEGRNWNNISREFSQEIADRYNALTAEERAALTDLAEWGEYSVFRDEILSMASDKADGKLNDAAADLASAYEKLGGANANLYDAFSIASENFSEESIKQFAAKQMNTRDYAKMAKEQGYDGVIFKNIHDNGGYSNGSEGASTVAIAFSSEQIKSVANEKPTKNPDIRKSLSADGNKSKRNGRYNVYGDDIRLQAPIREDIADLLDSGRGSGKGGYTYAELEKGLNAIIEDNGKENNAVSKRIEFALNNRLLYGYRDIDGMDIPANGDYINLLNEKQITEYNTEAFDSFMNSADVDAYAPPAEMIAPLPEKSKAKESKKAKNAPAYEAIRPQSEQEPQPRMKRADNKNAAPDGMEERSWYETSTGSEAVDNIITPDDIPDDVRYYQVKSNKKTLETANTRLARDGFAKSREYFEGRMTERKLTAEDIALGERLIQEAAKAGDAKAVRDLIIDVSIIGTELGQSVQALSMIRRLTPEGQLKALFRTVERGKAKGDKAFDGVEVTEDMAKKITDTIKEDGTFDQSELDAAVEDVKQEIADNMKVTATDYINAWRYLAMLGNPKTHIRNVVSNVAMFGTRAIKNAVARTFETIAPIKNRTKTWRPATKAVKSFVKQTAKEMESVIKGDNKYSDESSIKSKRKIFFTAVGNFMADTNTNALEAEDSIFSKPVFRLTLQEYLTANGIKTEADIKNNPKLVEKAKEYALDESRRATFRQDSYLANKIGEIERRNPVYGVAIGATMPFKKTPINVAKTGMAYSPLGFARNIYDAVKLAKGEMDASEAIDHLAQTLTGTSLALIGYALAESGILNGAGGDDKEDKYDYQLGEQSYSFNYGGDTYSLSWLSPVAMPLFAGANAYETLVEKHEWDANVVIDTLGRTLDPMSEMSFLSSLDNVLSSYDSGIDKFIGAGGVMAQSYATQFVPTALSQIAAAVDDTKRSTKVSGDSGFEFGEEMLNKLKYKIPGLRNQLEPTTDIWGNEAKQTENTLLRSFESFLSPANKREGISTAVDDELKALYRVVGESEILPAIPDDYINYKDVKYDLSAKDYTEYKQNYGQAAYDLMEKLFDTDTYNNASPEEKADMIGRVYDYARDNAKKQYFVKFGVEYTNAETDGVKVYKENSIKGAIEADLPVDEYVFKVENPEKYKFFKNNGISYATYKAADEDGKRAYTWAYENPGKYTMSKVISDDFMEYYGYRSKMNDFDAKDENGETVSGLKKERVLDYINNLDLDYGQRIILYRSMYSSKEDRNRYNSDIIDYLNSRDDVSYNEMVAILEELDMTVDNNGNIYWD